MLDRYTRLPLLVLVLIAAGLAFAVWGAGQAWVAAPIPGLGRSLAALAKDALFVPLKPLMYALIIMSIASSIAISRGGLGGKFVRVLSFFVGFSLLGGVIGVIGYSLFGGPGVLPTPLEAGLGAGSTDMKRIPFLGKLYGVLSSALMISIYAGLVFGRGLKALEATHPGIGQQADAVSDLFIRGFRVFLHITIPLAVFGSLSLALSRPGGVETLGDLARILPLYLGAMLTVWIIMVIVVSRVLGKDIRFMLAAVLPQAVVSFSTSSSIATLPATRQACDQLGADADEATPFYTIGATINMVGTMMGLLLLSLYAMEAYGIEMSLADRIVVGLQSLIYSVSAAGVPSASVVLLQEILTSQNVSVEYASYVTGLIITIDTLILDRLRTTLNTQSDSMSTAAGLKTYYRTPKVLAET